MSNPLFGPGLEPPPGIVPNFAHPGKTLRPLAIGITITCVIVVTISVLMRLFTKLFVIKKLSLEDTLCFISWLLFMAACGISFKCISLGIGVHQWDVPLVNVIKLSELANIVEIIYNPNVALIRISIFLQLIHIFVPDRKHYKFYLVQCLIWMNILSYSTMTFLNIFLCTPRAKIWNPTLPGKCVNLDVIRDAQGILNVVCDIAILLLPLFWISQLQMRMQRKIEVSMVFAAGIFACIASIMRFVESVKNSEEQDKTYDVGLALWVEVEVATGLLISSLPTLPRFFGFVVPKINTLVRSTLLRSSQSVPSKISSTLNIKKPQSTWRKNDNLYVARDKYHELSDLEGGTQHSITVLAETRTSLNGYANQHVISDGDGPKNGDDVIKNIVAIEQESINNER